MASFVKGTPQSTVNQYYQNNPWDARGTPTISNRPRSTMGQAQPTPTPSQGTPYGTPDMSAYNRPFTSTTTDWMGNTFSSPEAASAQQGAAVWGLTQQRAQQLGDLYSKGTPLSPLNMNAAYQSGAQMLEDGWQNPFLERLLPQAPPTQYRPQPTAPQPGGGGERRQYIDFLPPEPRSIGAPTPPRQPSAPQRPSPPSQFPVGPGLQLNPKDEARRQYRMQQEAAASREVQQALQMQNLGTPEQAAGWVRNYQGQSGGEPVLRLLVRGGVLSQDEANALASEANERRVLRDAAMRGRLSPEESRRAEALDLESVGLSLARQIEYRAFLQGRGFTPDEARRMAAEEYGATGGRAEGYDARRAAQETRRAEADRQARRDALDRVAQARKDSDLYYASRNAADADRRWRERQFR